MLDKLGRGTIWHDKNEPGFIYMVLTWEPKSIQFPNGLVVSLFIADHADEPRESAQYPNFILLIHETEAYSLETWEAHYEWHEDQSLSNLSVCGLSHGAAVSNESEEDKRLREYKEKNGLG
jgi:hypothetical protein